MFFSACALPSIQFKTRAFWRETRGLPHGSFLAVQAKSKTKPIWGLSNRFIKWICSLSDS